MTEAASFYRLKGLFFSLKAMKFFKKSGQALNNAEILKQKYAIYFNSNRLIKGISLTFIGWMLTAVSTVAFQPLVINNSIFITLFYIFLAASVPLLIWSLCKGKDFFICGKPLYVFLRAFLAVINYYTYFSSRTWISQSNNTLLLGSDTFFVPLLIYLFFKKKFSSLTWAGLLVSFCGLAIIYSFKPDAFSLNGLINSTICIVSGGLMAWLIIITCYIVRHDPPLRQSLYTALFGMAVSGLGALLTGWQQPTQADLIFMMIQGLIYAGCLLLFLNAADCIEPHIVVTLGHLVPLLVVFINSAFDFHPISKKIYFGSLVTVIGVVLVLLSTRFQRKEEDLILG